VDPPPGRAELRYLSRAGIEPRVELEVLEVAPFGLLNVDTSEGERSLPEEVASLIETAPATEVEA
jgi:DtxR family Mn-dependent transcriptional regulator